MSNMSEPPRTGYDLPVYGLAEGLLLHIHVPAILCIALSLLCAVATVLWSVHDHWRNGRGAHFFDWTQGERNIVYLAVCDGCFNLTHLFDHAHYVIVRDHVRPVWLCQLYAFVISEFICAQHLLVNLIALGACVTIHRERTVEWGARDWRQLLYTFGGSLLIDIGCLLTGAYGPTGSFCYFDPVAGVVPHLVFSVGPLVLLFALNVILYGLTFRKIRQEERKTRAILGTTSKPHSAASAAARTGMLFVAAFFVQWWASVVWGLWQLFEPPPLIMHQLATTFCNLGGILNFGVFYILRRRRRRRQPDSLRNRRSGSTGDTPVAAIAGCRPGWLKICRRGSTTGIVEPGIGERRPRPARWTTPDGSKTDKSNENRDVVAALPATTPQSAATPLSTATPQTATTPLSATTPQSTTTPQSAATPQAASAPLAIPTISSTVTNPLPTNANSPSVTPPPSTPSSPGAEPVATSSQTTVTPVITTSNSKQSPTPLCPSDLQLVTRHPVVTRKISAVTPRYCGRKAPVSRRISFAREERGSAVSPTVNQAKAQRRTPPQVIIDWASGEIDDGSDRL